LKGSHHVPWPCLLPVGWHMTHTFWAHAFHP
jgi:hypothetical protein